jgi:uncharacterized protein
VSDRPWFHTVVTALAIMFAGAAIGHGITRFRVADRGVTVKGVAERAVRADLALWPLRVTAAGEQLSEAQAKITRDQRSVRRFLIGHGIDSTEIELQGIDVADRGAEAYQPANRGARYVITATVIARSTKPETIQSASQDIGDLIEAGVVFSSGGYGSGPTYLFTKLNDLKPTMLAEATSSARAAANEFAKKAGGRIGGIKHASQGFFEILPRDQAPGISQENQMDKTLRVVTTVEFDLAS